MPEISKPDYTHLWSSGGAIVAPSDVKIQTGWTAEVPPFQWENWSQNRQDQAIAHVLQHGIAVWDNITEYQANKSYVQGSNGTVYRCLITNTNVNPVGDLTSTWRVAWLDSTSPLGPTVSNTAQARAWTNDTTFLSPLKLAQAFQGANQNLASIGYQKYPGGLIEQWGTKICTYDSTTSAGFSNSVTFPIAFTSPPTVIISRNQGMATAAAGNPDQITETVTASSFLIICAQSSGTNNFRVSWRAIGY